MVRYKNDYAPQRSRKSEKMLTIFSREMVWPQNRLIDF